MSPWVDLQDTKFLITQQKFRQFFWNTSFRVGCRLFLLSETKMFSFIITISKMKWLIFGSSSRLKICNISKVHYSECVMVKGDGGKLLVQMSEI